MSPGYPVSGRQHAVHNFLLVWLSRHILITGRGVSVPQCRSPTRQLLFRKTPPGDLHQAGFFVKRRLGIPAIRCMMSPKPAGESQICPLSCAADRCRRSGGRNPTRHNSIRERSLAK
jgi:hypothetical protein